MIGVAKWFSESCLEELYLLFPHSKTYRDKACWKFVITAVIGYCATARRILCPMKTSFLSYLVSCDSRKRNLIRKGFKPKRLLARLSAVMIGKGPLSVTPSYGLTTTTPLTKRLHWDIVQITPRSKPHWRRTKEKRGLLLSRRQRTFHRIRSSVVEVQPLHISLVRSCKEPLESYTWCLWWRCLTCRPIYMLL